MQWTAMAVMKMPKKLSKRAIIIVSLLALAAVLSNMIMFTYIEYVSSYKIAKNYINAQHRIMYQEMSKAVVTDDIYTVFTLVDSVAAALPYIDNIAVYDENGVYVADAKVLRNRLTDDARNVGISKELAFGQKQAGTMVYYISRMAILEEVATAISGLVLMNVIIVLTGALVGGYLSFRISKPVIDLSEHLQQISAPAHKTLESISKNRHNRNFRSKVVTEEPVRKSVSAVNLRSVKRRKK